MSGGRPTLSTVLRYALFQVPGVAALGVCLVLLDRWPGIPRWLFWGAMIGWIGKDVALFPFLWRSYDPCPAGRCNSMIGESGRVLEVLDPAGRVTVRGELWHAEPAEGCTPIEQGATVRIAGLRGLTLIVEPETKEGASLRHS